MAVILRRLFGVGKLPADLHDQIEAEGLIHLAEFVAVTRRFSGSIPGLRSQGSIASYVGSLAFTEERVLATLSVVPKLAGRVVDVRWDEAQGGAATAEISATGLQVDLDTAAWTRGSTVISRCTSRTPSTTMCWPACRCDRWPFDVPPEYVFRAVGVTYSPSLIGPVHRHVSTMTG